MAHFNRIAIVLVLLQAITPSWADGPHPRILVQPYDSETPTEVTTLPGVPTDLQLAPHEQITGLAIGDTIQWRVEELPGHLFIKPLRSGLFTAATLVTNQRVYPLLLRSTDPKGPWQLRVRWTVPSTNIIPELGLTPHSLNRHYTIKGQAEFRPHAVFDDGRFTWIDMGQPQVLPALFMVGPDGPQLVNYLLHTHYFVVQRLMPRFLLKLGGTEVSVTNEAYQTDAP